MGKSRSIHWITTVQGRLQLYQNRLGYSCFQSYSVQLFCRTPGQVIYVFFAYVSKTLYDQVIWVCRLQLWGCRRREVRRGVWTLALIFQKHFLNVCVKPNTSVQLFVNISITVRYFPTKAHAFGMSSEFFICL